jgi:hypothetical protein
MAYINGAFNPPSEIEQRVVFLENQLRIINKLLQPYFLQGRLRTDRSAPANSGDVFDSDKLYDRVVDANYEYFLIDNAGTLEWRRVAITVF